MWDARYGYGMGEMVSEVSTKVSLPGRRGSAYIRVVLGWEMMMIMNGQCAFDGILSPYCAFSRVLWCFVPESVHLGQLVLHETPHRPFFVTSDMSLSLCFWSLCASFSLPFICIYTPKHTPSIHPLTVKDWKLQMREDCSLPSYIFHEGL